MGGIIIRRATPADVVGIAHVWRSSRPDHANLADALELDGLPACYPVTLVAVQGDGETVGWLDGTVESRGLADELNPNGIPAPHAFVSEIDVHPKHRRKGIGRALFHTLVALADEAGVILIGLRAQEDEDLAHRQAFFRSVGLALLDGTGWVGDVRTLARKSKSAVDIACVSSMANGLIGEER
ncbi:GNAT family N-acetyltransferase [Microtetraspora sp. NBRC 13810]|uniref:GNAT family N-acetyltransferase n=1 Tax=Microtetraspora sp. NBRC 13810 TaxID=3030990 RepID=UPI00331E2304